MKLRTRLALTLSLAAVVLLLIIGWAQSRWHSQLRIDALSEAIVHRMESGGRERCEADPEVWPHGARAGRASRRGPLLGRGSRPRHRLFAYDVGLESRNPRSPAFPAGLAQQLAEGKEVAFSRSPDRRSMQIGIRMPWKQGPCAIVLVRAKGPPPWFSGAVLLPALLVALVVIVVALVAAGPIVRRVRHLTESVRRLGTAAETPIVVDGRDEIAELGAAFEQSRQTIHGQISSLREREAALRNYITNTTHDVMVPLSVLQGHLVSLQSRIDAGETLDAKAVVPSIEEAQYVGSLLHNLNATARLEATEGLAHRDPIDLNRLVERVVERHRPIARRKQIDLEMAVPEEVVELEGDLTLLEQALGNLVQNAIRYNRAGGHVAVCLSERGDSFALEVIDDGPGIPQQDRHRVFEPSFRGSEARTRHPHGMGLGLHIARDVATRHGLKLDLRDTEGGGLTVSVAPAGHERTQP